MQRQAVKVLPDKHPELGSLVAIDGSLIDAVLSMDWADYRKGAKKAKTHIGFDLNRGVPRKIFLTSGKDGERPFVTGLPFSLYAHLCELSEPCQSVVWHHVPQGPAGSQFCQR